MTEPSENVKACFVASQAACLDEGHDPTLVITGDDVELFCQGMRARPTADAMPAIDVKALAVLMSYVRAKTATISVEVLLRLDRGQTDGITDFATVAQTDPDVFTGIAVAECDVSPSAVPDVWVSLLRAEGWTDPEHQAVDDNPLTGPLRSACNAAALANLIAGDARPPLGTEVWAEWVLQCAVRNAQSLSVVGFTDVGKPAAAKVAAMAMERGMTVESSTIEGEPDE